MEERSWRELAACKGADPGRWFPEPGQDARPAIAVCEGCPVRRECLAYALAARESRGVYGGLTFNDRKQLMRRRQRRGAA